MSAAIVSPDASRTPLAAPSLDEDLANLGPQRSVPPCPSISLDQPIDQAAGAAHREMHAPAPLQERDQAVDRASR